MEAGETIGEAELEAAVNGRMCIVSRKSLPADALIRFVLGPDGAVVADLRRRLPGRGAHVEARRETVDLAVRRNLFARALKASVKAPTELGAEVDGLLARHALGALGLARKAGELVTGSAKVEAALRSGRALALVQAKDASPDGLRKVAALCRGGEIEVLRPFTSGEMDLALGGVNVVHAAVLAGHAGAAALKRLEALTTYRGASPGDEFDGRGPLPVQEAEAE
ncbi:RNA-binding protein [Aurantimonas sp. MSK8Z-1]|uniref:RNA-binding protein n=1 Tax=Mangrovibrevibacter kandeliae TaxID=2968473 RepID=UPI0021181783|nr:RNA-binding protein [Aurantimonas sp. MSK8Z-1]MCW4114974.1 RNA-binding protein [Aurantimonas sp. MSK8Z-1]